MRGSAPIRRRRAPEAAHASLAVGKLVDLDRVDAGNLEHDELRDPHARLDDERLARVGVQQRDLQLAAVAGVDQPRRVHDRDAVLRREARARLDEARVSLGDRDGEPGADQRALARCELDVLARREVEARVAGVGAARDDRVVAQPPDRQLDHAVDVWWAAASAIR